MQTQMDIYLANPRGFCAGVERAITIVNWALRLFGAPVYVRHEVVHNQYVVRALEAKGAIFVDELDGVPDGSVAIFSAHGVSKAVRREAQGRGLEIYDATCPLVIKVHMEVSRYRREDRECVLIGHAGHPEVEGTLGQYEARGASGGESKIFLVESVDDVWKLPVDRPDRLAYVTQTTLSMDDAEEIIKALRTRFPKISGPKKDDICYATQNRQEAVKRLAPHCDVFVVVGSQNSSNSNRLRELAEHLGAQSYLVDKASELQRDWFAKARAVGVTAGASAPEILVDRVLMQLKDWGGQCKEESISRREEVVFSLPKKLQDKIRAEDGVRSDQRIKVPAHTLTLK